MTDTRNPCLWSASEPAAPTTFTLIGRLATVALLLLASSSTALGNDIPGKLALAIAESAYTNYSEDTVVTLKDLVSFRTVHDPRFKNEDNPVFRSLVSYLHEKAQSFGFDFEDYGAVVVIGLGTSSDRLGIVTHADVQPADPTKWASDPFSLDASTEPGRLVGRGTEDDKGPLSAALYAMKAIKDSTVSLERRIELIVSLTEESDWDLFRAVLQRYSPPPLNVALDARYPVVIAEKGWGEIHFTLPPLAEPRPAVSPYLHSFTGGAFLSQVPEEAEAVIMSPSPQLESDIRDAVRNLPENFQVSVRKAGDALTLSARGKSAHSMEPQAGLNAITHLADLLKLYEWPDSQASQMVRLINDLVGVDDYGERFGDLAYSHDFMGRLTLTLATVSLEEGDLVANLSLRRPAGRAREQVEEAIAAATHEWKVETQIKDLRALFEITDPYYLEDAPHLPVLLGVFRHYADAPDAQPISIGGGSNARLVPLGVNFGPSMPGETYTGHSEHEFIGREQLLLNLRMYTAALFELATQPGPE